MKKELTAVDIAKDVIKLVKARKLVVATGKYFDVSGALETNKGLARSLKNVLRSKAQETCQVCAMGALLCAFVENKNEVKVGEAYDGGDQFISEKLSLYFSEVQLRLIETAFEGKVILDVFASANNGLAYRNAAIAFYSRYPKPAARLIAIMKNIIENNGFFNPPAPPLEILK